MGALVMLPVPGGLTQDWAANKTGGITPDPNGTPIQQLVYKHGNYQPHGHDGFDQDAKVGDIIVAPGSARVRYAGWGQDMPADIAAEWGFIYGPNGSGSGIITLLDHGIINGVRIGTYHAHQSGIIAPTGSWVEAGEPIGRVGVTGRSGGPHLHWSVVELPVNYYDPLYSRKNPALYLPPGWIIPYTPGGTGDAPTGRKTLVPGVHINI